MPESSFFLLNFNLQKIKIIILEPDIGRGGDHSAERCLKVLEVVLAEVYKVGLRLIYY